MRRGNRVAPSGDSTRYYDWLDRAGEDIISAGELLKNDNCYSSAAFHCQQAVEKALKAYILFKSGQLVEGHNLPWLCKRAMRCDGKFKDWLDESVALSRCYIETRYPADLPPELGYVKVKDYYRMAKTMYLFICAEADGAQR
ncbi:MAG: HEPN domain-containing protein [Oscillospiraceae bacterium]|jgi:HEPN domain-containing protein|nr:HEPN domain-containing protein [Oscillospiraceae bacterium]